MSDEETRDEAPGEDTVIESIEPSPEAESEFHPFDEIDEDFRPAPAVFVNGPDGLPLRVDQTSESDIPALSKNSLVCMGDFSKFVIRNDWGDVVATFEAKDVSRSPNGKYRVKNELARLQGATNIRDRDGEENWFEVFPIRPACQHYVRQQGSFNLNAAKKAHYRLCSARRTTEGTFMTVRDTGMWACDMREPYDAETIKVLDDFDNKKIAEGANREFFSIFQSTAAAPQKPKEEN
jgi:hypothetical protein